MKYIEIYNEYNELLREKEENTHIINKVEGYISTKTISGKKYYYLQKNTNGKLISKYIKKEMLQAIKSDLQARHLALERVKRINMQLKKLEKSARILDGQLHQSIIMLKHCAEMDSLPIGERKKSYAFGNAITALEGVKASKKTEDLLLLWVNGQGSYREIFIEQLKTLRDRNESLLI